MICAAQHRRLYRQETKGSRVEEPRATVCAIRRESWDAVIDWRDHYRSMRILAMADAISETGSNQLFTEEVESEANVGKGTP